MPDCVFCQIVAGKVPCHRINEDAGHLAFLSIFPNTDGFSVVIPKSHHDSNFAKASREVVANLVDFSRLTSLKICQAFPKTARCALVFEGYGVNHLHTKLIPLHNTDDKNWQPAKSETDQYFTSYQGYITTQEPAHPADDQQLASIAEKIRSQPPS